jgi:hypothetical protein
VDSRVRYQCRVTRDLRRSGAEPSGAVVEAPHATAGVLRRPEPGRLYPYVRRASYFELALFSGLLIVWAIPGLDQATFAFGLAHGVGFVCLAILIWIAVLRHETPYWLLAATLTPFGPVGSVIGIAHLDRRRNQEGRRGPA